jgi:hypothetical protein
MARTTVTMATAADEHYLWFFEQVEHRLGPTTARELRQTRDRLAHQERPDTRHLELGRWRVRIEDVLSEDPGLAEDLTLLRLDANSRLAGLR